ncbi:hypothetical protein A2U01_0012864 [Trifolium medium]|uniref:Uncharacterized protein n=1 Tax=Trifolium medium TaxID=97028 RepID=A0A392MX92_9FABA|nr:hypothetical protein [Trifolium medium]
MMKVSHVLIEGEYSLSDGPVLGVHPSEDECSLSEQVALLSEGSSPELVAARSKSGTFDLLR